MNTVTVKRLEAGDYLCSASGKEFKVYRITETIWNNGALSRPNRFGSYSNVSSHKCVHWAFNLCDGRRGFGGYGSKKQALDAAIRAIDAQEAQ
jgi:hypothetical protein